MKKAVTTILLLGLMPATGCSNANNDILDEPVSPALEGLQDHDEFFDTGWDLNHDITVNAVDNMMANWE